jgi:nitrate/nitrite transporter NarK
MRHITIVIFPKISNHLVCIASGRLIETEQWKSRQQRNTFIAACMRPIQAMRWPVFIPCFFYLVTFAWSVGINNALSSFLAQEYNFLPKNTGKLR